MLACALLQYTLTNPTFVINVIAKDWPRSVVSWGTLMSNSIVIIGSQPTSDDSVSELMVWTLNSNYTASYIYYWFVIAVVCFVLLFVFFFIFSFLNSFLSALMISHTRDLGLTFVHFFHYYHQLLLLQLLYKCSRSSLTYLTSENNWLTNGSQ